jgi:hypothetical protein
MLAIYIMAWNRHTMFYDLFSSIYILIYYQYFPVIRVIRQQFYHVVIWIFHCRCFLGHVIGLFHYLYYEGIYINK